MRNGLHSRDAEQTNHENTPRKHASWNMGIIYEPNYGKKLLESEELAAIEEISTQVETLVPIAIIRVTWRIDYLQISFPHRYIGAYANIIHFKISRL